MPIIAVAAVAVGVSPRAVTSRIAVTRIKIPVYSARPVRRDLWVSAVPLGLRDREVLKVPSVRLGLQVSEALWALGDLLDRKGLRAKLGLSDLRDLRANEGLWDLRDRWDRVG